MGVWYIMLYKYLMQEAAVRIPSEWLSIGTIVYSSLCMQTHHELFLITPMVLTMRLELSSHLLTQFYSTRPTLLAKNFPLNQNRYMWKKAAEAAWDGIDRLGKSVAV